MSAGRIFAAPLRGPVIRFRSGDGFAFSAFLVTDRRRDDESRQRAVRQSPDGEIKPPERR